MIEWSHGLYFGEECLNRSMLCEAVIMDSNLLSNMRASST